MRVKSKALELDSKMDRAMFVHNSFSKRVKTFPSLALILSFPFFAEICSGQAEFQTTFEASQGKETATYQEGLRFYQEIATAYPEPQD